MKIIIFPSTVKPVGVSTHVLNLALLLKKINVSYIILCPEEGWLSKELSKNDLSFCILNLSYKPHDFVWSSLKLYFFLKKDKEVQVVHLHGRFPILISLFSMIFIRRINFVVTIHQFYNISNSGFLSWKNYMEKWTLTHFVKKICCVSSDLNKHIVKELGQGHSEKILTIPNWIYPVRNRVIRSRELEGLNNYRKIKIIAVGRLVKEKGYDILIEALYNIINKGIKLYCDIFGDGPEKKNLIFQIIKYNLSNFIKLKGVSSNIRKVIPKYDFLVIPSREESFGLIVLEAYDAGIPVIASNTFGLREIVLNEKTGLFFEPNNAKSLAFQIIKLVNSPKLKISLAKNARQYVKNFYPNRDLLNKYIEFYEIKF